MGYREGTGPSSFQRSESSFNSKCAALGEMLYYAILTEKSEGEIQFLGLVVCVCMWGGGSRKEI